MAPASKANYKTYEAQARMVRAIVAAHPDVKWNYKGKPYLFHMLQYTTRHLSRSIVLLLLQIWSTCSHLYARRCSCCLYVFVGAKVDSSSQKSSLAMDPT
jgi:hypothetical protein